MCLAAARLPVTEARSVETLGRHLDELLDARILEHVFLRGRRLEHYVEREQFGLGPVRATQLERVHLKCVPNANSHCVSNQKIFFF